MHNKKDVRDVHAGHRRNKRKLIAIERILIPKEMSDALDQTLVSELAESFNVSTLLEPILVRYLDHNKHGRRYALVAGAHRLAALGYIGAQKADCILVEGNDSEIRLAGLAENLWRKNLTVLDRSVLLAEYFQLMQQGVSGQVVRKPGRPMGGIAAVGRALPSIGRSEEARRKIMSRALKIAALS
jgi:ParB-like chromosome segregation protein Spo0J